MADAFVHHLRHQDLDLWRCRTMIDVRLVWASTHHVRSAGGIQRDDQTEHPT